MGIAASGCACSGVESKQALFLKSVATLARAWFVAKVCSYARQSVVRVCQSSYARQSVVRRLQRRILRRLATAATSRIVV